jgi:hypothetical protein
MRSLVCLFRIRRFFWSLSVNVRIVDRVRTQFSVLDKVIVWRKAMLHECRATYTSNNLLNELTELSQPTRYLGNKVIEKHEITDSNIQSIRVA